MSSPAFEPGAGGDAQRAAAALRDGIDPYEHLVARPSELDRCPHCGGVGQVTADDELRFVCSLCGGPRFSALAEGLVAPPIAQAELRRAEKARKWRASWTTAAVTSGIALAMMVLVAGVFALFGVLKASLIVSLVFVLPFALAFVASLSRRSAAARELVPALDAAWAALATGAAQAGRATSPAALAKALGVDAAQAEQLHDVLEVESQLGVDPRVRIADDGPPRSQLAPDPRFDALEQRVASASPEVAAEAEAEAEAATLASAKTVVATTPPDPSRR